MGSRVTTFELFFDLVYVFTLTQVTQHMAHEHTAAGVLHGVLLLALVWFSWSAYAWLGNQARADLGVIRGGMTLAMAGMFLVALTKMRAGQFDYHKVDEKSVTVDVEGDMARLVGRIVTDATVYGAHADWRLQLTMDYAREGDTWTALRSVATTW